MDNKRLMAGRSFFILPSPKGVRGGEPFAKRMVEGREPQASVCG